MAASDIQGVFNFDEHFPGPHMIRLRLRKHQAWDVMRQLSIMLENDKDHIDFAWFGTLLRDAEEDSGDPIDVEK